jgi:transposase
LEDIEADGGRAAEEHDTDPDLAPELVHVDDSPAEVCEWPREHPHALAFPRGGRCLSLLVHGVPLSPSLAVRPVCARHALHLLPSCYHHRAQHAVIRQTDPPLIVQAPHTDISASQPYPELDTVGELETETYWREGKETEAREGWAMSLPRDGLHPVPAETARVAHAAFPDGNVYLRLRDELGTVFDDALFTAVYASEGHPALHPWQLALVSVMQFMENLSDRQAAQAVRARIDWKYALGLELTDEGFDDSVLSEFRSRLMHGSLEQTLLDTLLTRCQERGWLKARGRQRTDSTAQSTWSRRVGQARRRESARQHVLLAALDTATRCFVAHLRSAVRPQT